MQISLMTHVEQYPASLRRRNAHVLALRSFTRGTLLVEWLVGDWIYRAVGFWTSKWYNIPLQFSRNPSRFLGKPTRALSLTIKTSFSHFSSQSILGQFTRVCLGLRVLLGARDLRCLWWLQFLDPRRWYLVETFLFYCPQSGPASSNLAVAATWEGRPWIQRGTDGTALVLVRCEAWVRKNLRQVCVESRNRLAPHLVSSVPRHPWEILQVVVGCCAFGGEAHWPSVSLRSFVVACDVCIPLRQCHSGPGSTFLSVLPPYYQDQGCEEQQCGGVSGGYFSTETWLQQPESRTVLSLPLISQVLG